MYSKKLNNKSSVYISEEEISVNFEEAKFDFDLIEKSLNLFENVNDKVLFSRSIMGTGQEVFDALKEIVVSIETNDHANLSKSLQKDLNKFYADVLSAQLVLVNKNVASTTVSSTKAKKKLK